MKSKIYIKYKEGILDPQGVVTNKALNSIGMKNIENISIGKFVEIDFGDISQKEAEQITKESCNKLLVNPNTETFTFEIEE
tara:strand:- start:2483 stop:2725 length:243 start_codon:yes stop_codon:yes gene_type:complete